MEALSCSPFLYRKSLRARTHHSTKLTPKKPTYKFYLQPHDTLSALKSTIATHFNTLESDLKVYLTEIEKRTADLKRRHWTSIFQKKQVSTTSKTDFLPEVNGDVEERKTRSISVEPKTPVSLPLKRREGWHREAKPTLKRNDSLVNMLQSNGFEEDFSRIEHIIDELKADQTEFPAPCLDDLLQEVTTKQQLHQAYKEVCRPSCEDSPDPLVVFSKACDQMKVAPVSAIAKISGKKLVLNRYQLQTGLCHAIGQTIPAISVLRVVHLDQNGIFDEGGAALIKGVREHGKIASFYYTRNEVGMKVAQGMEGLEKSEVTELSFRGCKVASTALALLVSASLRLKELSKLCLSEIGLSDTAMKSLCSGLKKSKVSHLDLSNNQISRTSTKAFLTYLRRDKKLQYLDYSRNNLSSADNEVVYLLAAIVRSHPSLVHVNLSNTQLNDQGIALFVQGLKKSTTIVSVHLTGNPMELRTLDFLKRHLDARVETQLISSSADVRPAPVASWWNQGLPPLTAKKGMHGAMVVPNLKVRDAFGNHLIAHRDNIVNIFQSDDNQELGQSTESHILTRLLGHPEVLDGEKWVYSQHCWVCERWSIFTFTIKESGLQVIDTVDILTSRLGTTGKLAIKASFNNWQETPFIHSIGEEYSLSALLPPGAHRFWLIFDDKFVCTANNFRTKEEKELKINEILIPIRTTDVQILEATKEEHVRVFDKDKSVFKAFVEDTQTLIETMFANDMKFSKISRVVKNEADFSEVCNVLLHNFRDIKAIFEHTAAYSNFPSIEWLDFGDFCSMCQLMDKKYLNTAAVDRLFIAVNVEVGEQAEGQDDNPERELCRFEFFEILVRMAICKYQDLPLTPAECLRKLLNEHILKYGSAASAIEFRREKLYQLDVNDILEANLFSLQTVFAKYKEGRGKHITLDGIKRLLKKSTIAYNEKDLVKNYIFSKMSILDEMNANGAYEKMVFVEFLEFIGRLSETTVTEPMILYQKIESILEKILPCHGLKKKTIADLKQDSDDDFN